MALTLFMLQSMCADISRENLKGGAKFEKLLTLSFLKVCTKKVIK